MHVSVVMTILTFIGNAGELVCVPPNEVNVERKVAALVYITPRKQDYLVLADFVEGSTVNNSSHKLLGVSRFKGPPLYIPMTHTDNRFRINIVNRDYSQPKAKQPVTVIVHLKDVSLVYN